MGQTLLHYRYLLLVEGVIRFQCVRKLCSGVRRDRMGFHGDSRIGRFSTSQTGVNVAQMKDVI
jgi:hypothetical protein